MHLKCAWNPIPFDFFFLTWLSLENWDSLAQIYDIRQINFSGSIMTMELYNAQDIGHVYTRTDNKLHHFPSTNIVPFDKTPLPRQTFPCVREFMWIFFMISVTSQIDTAFKNEGFPGLLEDLWILCFHQGQDDTSQDSLDFYNRRARADWNSVG